MEIACLIKKAIELFVGVKVLDAREHALGDSIGNRDIVLRIDNPDTAVVMTVQMKTLCEILLLDFFEQLHAFVGNDRLYADKIRMLIREVTVTQKVFLNLVVCVRPVVSCIDDFVFGLIEMLMNRVNENPLQFASVSFRREHPVPRQ